MSNKLTQQHHLRNTLKVLSDNDFILMLSSFEKMTMKKLEITTKLLSYKSYESLGQYADKKYKGFGRSEQESIINCIKNFFESLINTESNLNLVMKAIKRENLGLEDMKHLLKGSPSPSSYPRKLINKPSISTTTTTTTTIAATITNTKNIHENNLECSSLALSITDFNNDNEVNDEPLVVDDHKVANMKPTVKKEFNLLNKSFGDISIISNTESVDINIGGFKTEGNYNDNEDNHDNSFKKILDQVKCVPSTRKDLSLNKVIKASSNHFKEKISMTTRNSSKENMKYLDKVTTLETNSLEPTVSSIGIPPSGRTFFQKKLGSTTDHNTNPNTNNNTRILHPFKDNFLPDQGTPSLSQDRPEITDSSAKKKIRSVPRIYNIALDLNTMKSEIEQNGSSSKPCNCQCAEKLNAAYSKIEILENHIRLLIEENKALRSTKEAQENERFLTEFRINSDINHEEDSNKVIKLAWQGNSNNSASVGGYNGDQGRSTFQSMPVEDHNQYLVKKICTVNMDGVEKSRSFSADLISKRKNNHMVINQQITTNQNFRSDHSTKTPHKYVNIKRLIPILKLDSGATGNLIYRPFTPENIFTDCQAKKYSSNENLSIYPTTSRGFYEHTPSHLSNTSHSHNQPSGSKYLNVRYKNSSHLQRLKNF